MSTLVRVVFAIGVVVSNCVLALAGLMTEMEAAICIMTVMVCANFMFGGRNGE